MVVKVVVVVVKSSLWFMIFVKSSSGSEKQFMVNGFREKQFLIIVKST